MTDKLYTAYVLSWAYSDGSGYEIVAALPDKDKAEGLLTLLARAADGSLRNYRIDPAPTLAGLFT